MSMIKSDLSRRFFLDVCAAGTVHIRERGSPGGAAEGVLPVFSTDTWDEANALRVRHCRLARDGSGLYTLNNPPEPGADAMEYLGGVSKLFRATYAETLGRRAKKVDDALADPKVRRAALDIIDRAAKVGE